MSIIENRSRRSGQIDAPVARRAAEMVDAAIRYCEAKTSLRGRKQVATALRVENRQLHDYFRHSLARQVATYLAQLDDSVVGVYTHSYGDAEEEGEDRSCSLTANINLILHVRRKTAALSSAVASLDQALLEQYKVLVAPRAEKMASLLDAQVADDRDVEEGLGFGAVLRSIFTKPVQLWAR